MAKLLSSSQLSCESAGLLIRRSKPNQTTNQGLKKTVKIIKAMIIKTNSQFGWSQHWEVTIKAISLLSSLIHPYISVRKELALFRKSRSPGLCVTVYLTSVQWLVWVGQVRSDVDRSGCIVHLYMLTSNLTSLILWLFSQWLCERENWHLSIFFGSFTSVKVILLTFIFITGWQETLKKRKIKWKHFHFILALCNVL